MIKNQNTLATLQKRQSFKTAIAELFSKIFNKKEISNKQFHHCKTNIFLAKFTKSINPETSIKSLGNDSLRAKFYKQIQNELFPNCYCLSISMSYSIIITLINPGKFLATWVLALKQQESYLSYI